MKKRFFVADLDGTLLHRAESYLVPHKEERDAIHEVIRQNHEFVVASGRLKNDIDTVLENMGISSKYTIAHNGAMIYKNNELISCKTLQFEKVKMIVHLMKEWGYKPEYISITTEENELYMKVYSWKGLLLKLRYSQRVSETREVKRWKKDTIESLEARDEKVTRILIAYHNQKKLKEIKEKLHGYFGQEIEEYFSGKYSLEICAENVSKATAIQCMMEEGNIEMDEIAFVGDSGNDVSAFEYVENSYVMAHAQEEFKKSHCVEVPRVSYAIKDFLEKEV